MVIPSYWKPPPRKHCRHSSFSFGPSATDFRTRTTNKLIISDTFPHLDLPRNSQSSAETFLRSGRSSASGQTKRRQRHQILFPQCHDEQPITRQFCEILVLATAFSELCDAAVKFLDGKVPPRKRLTGFTAWETCRQESRSGAPVPREVCSILMVSSKQKRFV